MYKIFNVSREWFVDQPEEFETILEAFDKAGVFTIEKEKNGDLTFTEGADDYNSITLNKEQVFALIKEIVEVMG